MRHFVVIVTVVIVTLVKVVKVTEVKVVIVTYFGKKKQLDTLTTDEMFSGQHFAILNDFLTKWWG